MKKIYFSLVTLSVILCVTLFFACNKERKENIAFPSESYADAPAMRSYLVSSYGLQDINIAENDTSFIIEGDVVFLKRNFWTNYAKPANNSAAKNYRSLNLVTAITSIQVSLDPALPTAWKTAFRTALTKWNALNGKLVFSEVTGYCPAYGITILWRSLGSSTGNVIAQAIGFPSGGYPGNSITVNWSCTTISSMSDAKRLHTGRSRNAWAFLVSSMGIPVPLC